MKSEQTYRVLMICTGNICRSPTAHGVFEKMVADAKLQQHISVDSAGTHSYHVGEAPDARSQKHARLRGYDLSTQRARQLTAQDFEDFDLVLMMDSANEAAARRIASPAQLQRMRRLTDYCQRFDDKEVPDPYYGGQRDFSHCLEQVEQAVPGVVAHLRSELSR